MLPDEIQHILRGDAVVNFREAQGIKVLEAALHQRNGDGIEGVETLQGGPEVPPLHPLPVVRIQTLTGQAPGLL